MHQGHLQQVRWDTFPHCYSFFGDYSKTNHQKESKLKLKTKMDASAKKVLANNTFLIQ